MNKSDLVTNVSSIAGLTRKEAEKAVDAVLDSITNALQEGSEVRLIGFGTFLVASRAQTEGRNPKTGEKILIPAKKVPKFRPGKVLRSVVEIKE